MTLGGGADDGAVGEGDDVRRKICGPVRATASSPVRRITTHLTTGSGNDRVYDGLGADEVDTEAGADTVVQEAVADPNDGLDGGEGRDTSPTPPGR